MIVALGPAARHGYVLHERARRYHWQGEGLLSVKTFFGGRALYDAGGGRYAVDDRSYLVLNGGQPYAIEIESATPVESLCVFFAPRLADDVRRGLTVPVGHLLDDPWRPAPDGEAVRFVERTYHHDDLVSPALARLRAALIPTRERPEPAWLVEQAHDLMARLLRARGRVQGEIDALPLARPATREEAYRRAYLAKEYADALFDGPVTLDDMARVACLSPNHLLRTFTLVVGQTPHQYVTARRLERARHLLARTDAPVTEVCFAAGFHSLGSFSAIFRRSTGMSPTAFRRACRQRGDFREAPCGDHAAY